MQHKSDTPSLTLAEFVTAAAGSVPEIRRDLVERRIAHWIAREVLRPIGPLATGSGRHRRFDPEQPYIAAVLLRLPLRSIAEVKAVATVLGIELARGAELTTQWKIAKDRSAARQHRTIFAAFNVRLDDAGEKPIAVDIQVKPGVALESPSFHVEGLSAIVVNLTDTFSLVRLP
jgi:hypothetical protein